MIAKLKNILFPLVLLLFLLNFSSVAYNKMSSDWLRSAQWGVFVHYLAKPGMTPQEWNEQVNSFNTEMLSKQLKQIGVKYFFITIGQNSGYYCSPNQTYDKYIQSKISKCSKRDLISDLYISLHPQGIKLMVYLPAGAPALDRNAVQKLEWTSGPYKNEAFQRKWENVIREWSLRWGKKVDGWWFDGVYWPKEMYESSNPPNFKTFASAARAGNPNSLIAFNPGVFYPITNPSSEADFTAGELNYPQSLNCKNHSTKQAQLHVLSFLGSTWGEGQKRFSDREALTAMQKVIKCNGVMTWDVPILKNGIIPSSFMSQLIYIQNNIKKPMQKKIQYARPLRNIASFKQATLLNLNGSKELPVNRAEHFAEFGIDGNLGTFAQAANEWAWTYQIDLEAIFKIKQIAIVFGPYYATDYEVLVSKDAKIWNVVASDKNAHGGRVLFKLNPMQCRYIRIKANKPNSENQPGKQMSIAEVEVYGL